MMKKMLLVLVGITMSAALYAEPAPDSKRLALAKDYIADEQWARAIAELRVVANDARDANRDEALFWLAHSEHQTGDQQAAIETISQLERLFPRSAWVRPARSLRVEIAQRLRRDDVLWVIAQQPTPAAPPTAPAPTMPPAPRGRMPVAVTPPATPPPPGRPAPTAVPPGFAAPTPMPTTVMRPPRMITGVNGLLPEGTYTFDTDLKIEALVGLMDAHSDRVIPLLREIALDDKKPNEARRALFALVQSNRPAARSTVIEVAKRGPNAVRLAAIREIGRFPEPAYTATLVSIAKGESDPSIRDTAIVTLGRTGSRVPLRLLYSQMPRSSRSAVLIALGNAKDDDELIRIATNERDQALRTRARQQLRLLGTPKAVKFLTDNP